MGGHEGGISTRSGCDQGEHPDDLAHGASPRKSWSAARTLTTVVMLSLVAIGPAAALPCDTRMARSPCRISS